jgi:hypothetical protein
LTLFLCFLRSVVRRRARRMPTEQRRHMAPFHLPPESDSSFFTDDLRLHTEVTRLPSANYHFHPFMYWGFPPKDLLSPVQTTASRRGVIF